MDYPEKNQGVYISRRWCLLRRRHQDSRNLGLTAIAGYTIDGITCNSISSTFGFDDDHILFLLTDDDSDLATIFHGVKEDLVSEDIEFLLVIAGCIGGSGEAEKVD
jgi:hypothetical protein